MPSIHPADQILHTHPVRRSNYPHTLQVRNSKNTAGRALNTSCRSRPPHILQVRPSIHLAGRPLHTPYRSAPQQTLQVISSTHLAGQPLNLSCRLAPQHTLQVSHSTHSEGHPLNTPCRSAPQHTLKAIPPHTLQVNLEHATFISQPNICNVKVLTPHFVYGLQLQGKPIHSLCRSSFQKRVTAIICSLIHHSLTQNVLPRVIFLAFSDKQQRCHWGGCTCRTQTTGTSRTRPTPGETPKRASSSIPPAATCPWRPPLQTAGRAEQYSL